MSINDAIVGVNCAWRLCFRMQRTGKPVRAGPARANSSKRCGANPMVWFRSVPRLFIFALGWFAGLAYHAGLVAPLLERLESLAPDLGGPRGDGSRPQRTTPMPAVIQQCTAEQLDVLRHQLPPDECLRSQGTYAYLQKCSFTYATRCPESVWLDEHYHRVHSNASTPADEDFIGIYVGCNKGMDAVNTMRMLSGNPQYDKTTWKETMQSTTSSWHDGVCGQEYVEQFPIPVSTKLRPAQVHCIEPMPVTVGALQRSAKTLGWDQQGFAPVMGAMAIQDGTSRVPSATSDFNAGVENKGMVNWKIACGSTRKADAACETLVTYRLDTYVDKFINNFTHHEDSVIQLLSVDVEGFDFDVLQGGPKVLGRVQYLEFEYNWMGRWKQQNLTDAISMLENVGFVCYWPGTGGKIWRISGCWLDHYAARLWSNVACVNQNFPEVAPMADRMEELFLATLAKGKAIHYGPLANPKKKNKSNQKY